MTGLSAAGRDIAGAIARRWFWTRLGWQDVRQRFSGSLFGSFWITLNLALMVTALSLVFSGPLGTRWSDYLPFVASGLVLWQFIQASLNESSTVFVSAADTIRNAPLPLSVHILRLLWRNLIVLLHNLLVLVVVLVLFQVRPAPAAWTIALALPLMCFTLFWLCLLIGLAGARFRDVAQIVANLLQILFFVTPVFWPPEAIGAGREWIVALNPLFALIDIVRAPLLGDTIAPSSWPMALALAAGSFAAGLAAFARARTRVAYWI